MMRICPKCGAYYADGSSAFCLVDGTPLVNVDPTSENWSEGTRKIAEKAKALQKQKKRLKWRRVVVSAATVLVGALILYGSFTLETTPTPVYKISGRAMEASTPLDGVKIILDGAKTASTTTAANGSYSFTDLPAGGSYTITPVPRLQLVFTEPSITIAKLQQDTAADFQVQRVLYKISGSVFASSNGVRAVTIRLSGPKTASTTTDPKGNYSFTDLPAGGTYTITAVPRPAMIFTQPSITIVSLRQDAAADFHVQLYKISGQVLDGSQGMPDVRIILSGAKADSTTTDPRGNYSFTDLPAGGNYIITPDAQRKLKPTRLPFNNLAHDDAANFSDPAPDNSTPAEVCTTEERKIEKDALLDKYGVTWRGNIALQESEIIAATLPPGVGRDTVKSAASLGPISYEVSFLKDCTPDVVIASYKWQVTTRFNGREKAEVVTIEKRKTCAKVSLACFAP